MDAAKDSCPGRSTTLGMVSAGPERPQMAEPAATMLRAPSSAPQTPCQPSQCAGGAFPEIHVAQYPLDMGRTEKGGGAAGGQTLALTVNAEGDINYDAVLAQSKNAQQWLQTTHKALVPKPDLLTSGVRCAHGCVQPGGRCSFMYHGLRACCSARL